MEFSARKVGPKVGKGLAVELAADREVGRLAEEILRVVHPALGRLRDIREIQRRNLEHLSGALRIRGRDQRRVHVDEATLLKKPVNGIGRKGTDPEHCLESVGSRAQMRDRAQIFHGMALLLQRIIRRGSPFHRDGVRLDFKRLLCLRRRDQSSLHGERCADIESGNLREIRHGVMIDHLNGLEAGAVMQNDKAEGL